MKKRKHSKIRRTIKANEAGGRMEERTDEGGTVVRGDGRDGTL